MEGVRWDSVLRVIGFLAWIFYALFVYDICTWSCSNTFDVWVCAVAFWWWKSVVACTLLTYYIAQKAFVCTCVYMKIFDTTSKKCWDLGIIKMSILLFLNTQFIDSVFWNVWWINLLSVLLTMWYCRVIKVLDWEFVSILSWVVTWFSD